MNENANADSAPPQASDLRREAERRLHDKKAAPVEGMAEVDVRALLHELQVHQIELEMQNEELLRAQTAVQEVSDKYHDLFDFAPVGYFRLDEQGRILEVNLAGAALLGLDRSTAVKQRFVQFVAMEHRAAFAEFCKRVSATAAKQTCEIELRRNEEPVYALVEGVPAQDSGAKRSLRVTVTDITDRKLAEQERERLLRKIDVEKARLTELFEHSPAFMCVLRGRSLVFERANEEYFRVVGRRDILGKSLREALPEVANQGYFEILDRVYETGEPFVGKEMVVLLQRTAEGPLEERYVDFLYQPLREADGSISGIFVHGVDITDRKRGEASLHTRLRLSELAQHSSADKLIQVALDEAEALTGSCIGFFHVVDEDQQNLTLQAWSTNTLRNMCRAEGKGRHYPISEAGVWVDCFHARKPVIHNDYASLAHKKGLPEGHAPVVRDLGVPIFRGHRVVAIMGVGNKAADYTQDDVDVLQSLAVPLMDLLEYNRADEALRDLNKNLEQRVAQRTAELEQRADQLQALAVELTQAEQRERRRLAQVLHDQLQQLLVAARMKIGLLRSRVQDDQLGQTIGQLDDLLNLSINESRSLVVQLCPPVLYNRGLAAALEWLADQTREKFDLAVEIQADPAAEPAEEATRAFLFQAAGELLLNATKHAQARRVQVRMTRVVVPPSGLPPGADASLGAGETPAPQGPEEVCIAVCDDGMGFDPAQVAGKPGGGFGMFSIRQRLEVFGGRLEVLSSPGQGTQVTIRMPRTKAAT